MAYNPGPHTWKMVACGQYGPCANDQVAFTAVKCSLQITSFTGDKTTIKPSVGGVVNLSGAITDTSGATVNWTISVDGRVIKSGAGKAPSAAWDGKKADGTVAPAGSYPIILKASTAVGCEKTATFTVTVEEDTSKSCPLDMPFGSTANVASGALSHSQTLFSMPNSKLMGDFTLAYNSMEGNSSVLGRGWTHSYTITLKPNNNSTYTLKEGSSRTTFHQNGSTYTPRDASHPVLVINADGSATVTHKDGTVYTFSPSGAVASITDRNANMTSFTYDTSGKLSQIITPIGSTVTLTYNASNWLDTITDHTGNTHSFTYTGNTLTGIATQSPSIAPINWTYTYDPEGFMLSKTDPLGYRTDYSYDSSTHRVQTSTDPEGYTRTNLYPTGSETIRTTAFTEKDGGQWTYTYDTDKGVLLEKTDPLGGKTTYTYDSRGNKLTETDPAGGVTTYTYDASDNMISVKDALTNTTSYTYNSYGQVLTVTDPKGNVTTYTYDASGNLTTVAQPGGAATQYQYDSRGNMTSMTDANNKTTTFTYDAFNNLSSITDPSGAVTTFTYDAIGNMTEQKDASNNITRYEYDTLGRMTKVTDPLGNITAYAYDAGGNRTAVTDPRGGVSRYEYTYQGKVKKVTDAAGKITAYTYGNSGCASCGGSGSDKLTAITDAKANITAYEYDTPGRLIKETDPLLNIITYSYDSRGNLSSKTDSKGTVSYTYDALSRLTRKSYPDGSFISYGYDSVGNLTTTGNQHISYTFTYDALKRVTQVTDSASRTIGYSYDAQGNKQTMTDPMGRVTQYAYTDRYALSSIQSPLGTVSFGYDTVGRRSELNYPNGLKTVYGYDTESRLSSLVLEDASAQTVTSFSYGYDSTGNRTSITTVPDPGSPSLIAEQATYGTGNRIVEDNTFTYGYDNNGNLTTKTNKTTNETTTFTWDYDNKLIRVDTPSSVIQYKYDPFGRRIEKNVNGAVTKYLYDNEDILFEYDGNGNILRSYTHGPGIDEPLAVDEGGNVYFYHADALGSISTLTNNSGVVVQRNVYDSYGKIRSKVVYGQAPNQPFAYTSREHDEETGMDYYRARYYDPSNGRFISFDPILHPSNGISKCSKNKILNLNVPSFESLLKKPQHLNPYSYVVGNPLTNTDPTGLACGSGSTEAIIPDHFGFWSFESACNGHDNCYSTCGNAKMICDLVFWGAMIAECNSRSPKPECYASATLYYSAVFLGGGKAYRDAQKENCCNRR